jgi:GNAT superfamily N-acetyltransferase
LEITVGIVTKPSLSPEVPIEDKLTFRPANEASWEDLQAVLGASDAGSCHCQRLKTRGWMWTVTTEPERAALMREQTNCDDPEATRTSGLVAYLDGEPVGWCAVEPRTAYPRLFGRTRVPWAGRDEDKEDDSVWVVTCFVTRLGYRRRGVSYGLARATIDFARERGARALEGYPMMPQAGKDVPWGELNVGHYSAFQEAGFEEVSHPTLRRYVMRIAF